MKEIPIIFSAPMVQALLDGRKTMTRRIAWRSENDKTKMSFVCDGERPNPLARKARGFGVQMGGEYWLRPTPWVAVKAGDRLWVRESVTRFDKGSCDQHIWYHTTEGEYPHAEGPARGAPYKVPSIYMPRFASRLTLIVMATKIERLQDISPTDAKDEGAVLHDGRGVGHTGYRHDPSDGFVWATCRESFERLWKNLHGSAAWAANPEVVALSFSVHKRNIDELPIAEAA